jgi:hypothetical protein
VPLEDVRETELLPDLSEAWVDVEEHPSLRGGEQLRVAHEAHDVEKETRILGRRERLRA